jgi:hypothetical protein
MKQEYKDYLVQDPLHYVKVGCFHVNEYHLGCHKCNFIAHRNQKSFKLLINYQDITKMKY